MRPELAFQASTFKTQSPTLDRTLEFCSIAKVSHIDSIGFIVFRHPLCSHDVAEFRMMRLVALFALAYPIVLGGLEQSAQRQPLPVFTRMGLTPAEVAAVDKGRPVAKVLSRGEPSEVYVFGAVHITGSPDTYLKSARDIKRLAAVKGYLGIGELPPTSIEPADLSGIVLDPGDIKSLKDCKEGDCDVQLPRGSIQAFRKSVNWDRADAADQVNRLAREMLANLIREYRKAGNAALGEYRDNKNPTRISQQFEKMVGRATALPDVLPELQQYLLRYPDADLPGADSFMYWEKVEFGMKPTIRVNHAVIYNVKRQDRNISVVAIKQLYASHYFHTALDLTVCVPDPSPGGFYLLTLKASEQGGLTGITGSALRQVAVGKIRSSLESALASIKRNIEQSAPAAER